MKNGYIDNNWRHGDGTNWTTIEGGGRMIASGTGVMWDEIRVPLERGKLVGPNQPTYSAFRGGAYAYSFVNGDEIRFTAQIPHTWLEGSLLYPHIHWSPSSNSDPADNVGIGWEVTGADLDEEFPATLSVFRDISTRVDRDHYHLHDDIPVTGLPGAGALISNISIWRLFRQAAAVDDYPDPIFIHEFDIHFQVDTLGSRELLVK